MLCVLGCGAALSLSAASVADLQRRMDQNEKLTVIDVRSPALFARGHIPGAINVPASVCPLRSFPKLGKIVVYGGGLGRENVEEAAKALGAKPGIAVETLDGGYAAWESAHAMTTATRGFHAENLNYITYAELKRAKLSEVYLVDLRKPHTKADAGSIAPSTAPLTDLSVEFPGAHLGPSVPAPSAGSDSLVVLIDNGDGETARDAARKLKAGGAKRYVILVGGELSLARKGQPGLQRTGAQKISQP